MSERRSRGSQDGQRAGSALNKHEREALGIVEADGAGGRPEGVPPLGPGGHALDPLSDGEFDDEEYVDEMQFVRQAPKRPVLTPADGMSRAESTYVKSAECDALNQSGVPPPSRGGQTAHTKPSVIADTPWATDDQHVHVAHIPIASTEARKFDQNFRGKTPDMAYITTYTKTFNEYIRDNNIDYEYESHEGERKTRKAATTDRVAHKLIQQIGDKVRQRFGGRVHLRKAFKQYATDQALSLDVNEFRAALRIFNMPISHDQSEVLFAALGVDVTNPDAKITFHEFAVAIDDAQGEW